MIDFCNDEVAIFMLLWKPKEGGKIRGKMKLPF